MLRAHIIAFIAIPFLAFSKPIPVEDLFRNSEFVGFQISPDGTHVAALGEWEDRYNLFVFNLETGQPRRLTEMKRNNVGGIVWASNDRIIYRMDEDGNETFGMFAIDKDGGNPQILVPTVQSQSKIKLRITSIIDLLEDDPDHILVSSNDKHQDYPDVYLMNIQKEQRKKIVLSNPGKVVGWMTDQEGNVRIGIVSDQASKTDSIIYRENEKADWEKLATFPKNSPNWLPAAFDHDGKTLYIASNLTTDKRGIYKYDLEKREIGSLIFEDDEYDSSGLIYSDYRKAPIGVRYSKEKATTKWFDEEKEVIQEIIDNTLPDTINLINSMPDDESKFVVASFSDVQPVFYTLFSIENGSLQRTPLGFSRKWQKPETMANTQPITYQARDGLTIHGYFTLPKDYNPKKKCGLIVYPHGGPWARDNWGFDPSIQFFASRGFAVLQMNFRCSEGYGLEHLNAGNKKWGEEMQYDVVDGLKWALENANIDEKRVGIYGGSYGGYTVMSQVTQFPELYSFGINVVGVVDLYEQIEFYKERDRDEAVDFYHRTIGHTKEDRELLEKHSPINYIENIDDPIFIIHGVRDPRVSIAQARMLRAAMKKHGKKHEWLVKTDEGHGFRKEENRIEEFEKIEKFIKPWTKL
ncbi:S9 family peptidase [Pelagicoccus mobilis]|uniref:S9 family peptidase n=1 Tax=Pelagicoccus mobilis TaxID=415221 RepID=A0A934RVZ3_9BACT|nr:S9 family peptidase [Pelagicoccus mobilis]MBK1875427.1 S9 family peptidase [Pelagicoccus mobilis]